MSPARPPVEAMSVPTLDRLRADLGQTYWLTLPSGERIGGEVRAARAGVPMNEQHCCYSAQLALPQVPEAVFHYPYPQASAGQSRA